MAYTYTDKYYYYYDATLTQTLLDQYVSTINPANSSGTHFVYLNNAGTMSAFTGTRHTPNHEEHSGESDVPRKSTQTSSYENFTAAVNVNFAAAWSAASAFGSARKIPNGITLADDDTYAANITFANGGDATAEGNDTRFTDLTFTNGGTVYLGWVYGRDEEVVLSSGGLGNVVTSTTVYYATTGQKLNGLRGKLDFDGLYLQTGASASATDVVISRNMRKLDIANDSGNHNVKNRTGSGTVVDSVTVSGRLNSVYVGSGALLNMLTVGLQRSFTSADISAFGYFSSSYFGSGGSWVLSSATYMNIESGGTASNIYLNNGGIVTVFGPEDRVSSTWNSTTQQYDVTTSYASGAGGTLTNLQMAVSGGLQFDGLDDSETWQESNGVYWSADYRSHHRAAAPQSAYVEFQSNTSGSNVTIGNGGSMRIGKGASVVGISMGALTTSTFHTSGGKQMTWVGDRGAKLTIDGGFASNVVVEGAPLTRDYFFAVNNDFSTLSSSIQRDYYESHGSYLDNNAASALASAGYNAYMSSRYNEIQGNYDARYLGGEIIVNGGTLLNASGFAYLYAGDDPDWTFTSSGVSMTARTGEMVSKAVGALSATVEVGGAAHVTSITVAGGRFVMGGNSGGVARWANQSNAQSNYAQAEYIDLRTSGLVGSNNSAMVLFGGYNGSGQQPVPVMSNGSQVYDSNGYRQWDYYAYECTDPGEIHYLTADKGLVVKDLGWGGQDFTYTGSGAVTINGLGTVVLKDNHERRTSDSYYGKGPYLGPAYNEYYFGVVKGVYDEENGKLQKATILNGEGGFDWKGFLVVGSGGIVQDIGSASPLKTGNDIVNSDTWTPSYTYDECKVLTVVAGGSADNVTVKGSVRNFEHNESQYTESRAGLLVSSGGTATNVTVLEGGIAMAKGGTIDKVFVGAGGALYLSGWAGAHQVAVDSHGSQLAGPQYLDTTVLNAVRLDSGGQLTNTLDWGFRSGGHAPSVIANAGGGILNGVTANGVAYVSGLDYAGNITLTNGQQGLDLTVRGYKKITSRDDEGNPAAYTTVIASLNVSSGGIVKGATVGDEGAIYVSEGADVSGLTASGGRLIFENAGSGWGNYLPASATVNGLAVEAGGILEVNSKFGLTASNVQIGQNAGLSFTLGDTASEDYTPTELNGTWTAAWGGGSFYTDDGVLSGFGGQFGQEYKDLFYSSSYMSAPLTMTIIKGGVLSGADLRGCGNVQVTSGGKIMNAKIKGVGVGINSGGYASGLSALTDPDRTASQTQIWAYGSGATLDDTVLNGGLLGLDIGAVANGVTMTAPEGYTGGPGDAEHYGPAELDIYAGGTANDVVASAGIITLEGGSYKEPGMAGPTLNNADVHSSASIIVMSDDGVMSGKLNLGGTVVTTAKRTEYVPVEVDDVDYEGNPIHYTDYQPVEKNNATVDATNLTVNFDLTERNGSEEYAMIDNLANLQGAKLGTITISAEQKSGSYVLAGGAEAFKGSLTVTCGSENIGSISAGNSLQGNKGTVYKLSNTTDDGLVFSVMAGDVKPTDVPADFSVSVKNSNAAFSWKKAPVPKGLTATYEIRVNGGEKTFKTSSNKYTSTMDVGKYTFEIRTLLSDGSVSEWSDPIEVEVKDVTPPVLKSLTVTQSGEDSVLVEWTPAEDNVGVDHYVVTCGNMEPVEVPGNEHSYEFFGLGGQVAVTLTAADAAGNTGKALKQSLKIEDVTPPDQVTGLAAEDNGKAGVILSWEKPYDNVGVTDYKITLDGKEYKSKTNSLKVTKLAAGEHSFTVAALDKAKNESDPSEDCPFEVADLTPPVTGALSLEQDGEDGVRLTWTPGSDDVGVDHYVVTCGEQEDTVDSPELEYTFFGVAGKVTATLTAVDAAGNAGKTVKKTITLKDMTLPDQVSGLYAEEVDNKSGGVLAWEPAYDNVGVTQYLISVEDENGKKTSYTSKTNSVKVKKMPAGEYKFTVVAVDKAKNRSEESGICEFEVADVIDPKIRKLSAKVNKDNSATVTWSATDETKLDRVEYTLSLGDDVISMDTQYGESGTLDFKDLAAGNYALRMTAYDLADNESVEKKVSFKIKGNLASLS